MAEHGVGLVRRGQRLKFGAVQLEAEGCDSIVEMMQLASPNDRCRNAGLVLEALDSDNSIWVIPAWMRLFGFTDQRENSWLLHGSCARIGVRLNP